MKLYDWLLKADIADPLDIDALITAAKDGRKLGAREGYKSDGLHVIGTCEECTWWDKTRSGNSCTHKSGLVTQCSKDDGCIHFENKCESG